MALLGAWGLWVRTNGAQLSFRGDEGVLRYMSRMDVFRCLCVTFTEYFERHAEVGRFIPIKLVDDSASCKLTVDAICDLVLHHFDNPHQFLPALEWAVNEVVDNILIHAAASVPGVVCAQVFPARERIEIGVCDMGRGLKASLNESMALRTDADAIAMAVRRGITRDPKVGMGNGLAGTVEIAGINGGRFELWSGNSTFCVDNGKETGFVSHPHLPGTGLCLSLQTTHPVDLRETFIGTPGWTYIEAEADRVADSGGLRVTDECAHTGNRQPAALLRRKVLALLTHMEMPLVLDFDGVGA